MNIEEMKEALASDATKKADRLEKEIKRLNRELSKKEKHIEKMEIALRQMFNRCRVLTMGSMCIFCGHREACHAKEKEGGCEK